MSLTLDSPDFSSRLARTPKPAQRDLVSDVFHGIADRKGGQVTATDIRASVSHPHITSRDASPQDYARAIWDEKSVRDRVVQQMQERNDDSALGLSSSSEFNIQYQGTTHDTLNGLRDIYIPLTNAHKSSEEAVDTATKFLRAALLGHKSTLANRHLYVVTECKNRFTPISAPHV